MLLEPQTFMNESGRSVAEAARFIKLPPADIVILHDEIDLAPGKVRVKLGGGTAGHNGLRSVDACLGTREFKPRAARHRPPGQQGAGDRPRAGDFPKAEQGWL